MNAKRNLFITLVSLLTVLACAIPGQGQPASAPAPTIDTGKLETMVADTVANALTQTQQAAPVMPLSTSTPAPTDTPTPGAASDIGSTLQIQENGSTIYTDDRAGYSILIPSGWLAVRVNQQEYYDAWSLASAADPRIQQSLLSIQNLDPNIYRLFSFDVQDGHLVNDVVTNILFLWDQNDTMSFDTDEDLQKMAEDLPKNNAGLKVLSSSLVILPNSMTVGVIESESTTKNSSGNDVTIFQKQVFFKVSKGTQGIALTTENSLKDVIVPAFDSMVETITLK